MPKPYSLSGTAGGRSLVGFQKVLRIVPACLKIALGCLLACPRDDWERSCICVSPG